MKIIMSIIVSCILTSCVAFKPATEVDEDTIRQRLDAVWYSNSAQLGIDH